MSWEILAIVLYFAALITVAVCSYKKHLTDTDFILGNRSMNLWLTALAVHASDMSSWLFMGYPAKVFTGGLGGSWIAIGLWIFMLINWKYIAPKVRTATEQYNSLTFSSFFESRLGDTSGWIRVFTALMLFVFYTIYISAALVSMGLVLNILFGMEYHIGVIVGILIVLPYVFVGGYLTLAWIDLFQGLFLLVVIAFVPFYLLPQVGGFTGITDAIASKGIPLSPLANWHPLTIIESFFLMIGWGLGYLGQPHIITKYMGIRNISDLRKAKWVGMSWMTIALGSATLVGLVGIAFFTQGFSKPEEIFILMVRSSFAPFLVGLILCAIFAASINAMSSMVLVLSSSLTEDIYKKVIHKGASHRELLHVSRISVAVVSLIAFMIAFVKIDTIYGLVLYAWSGLGASFGPLLVLCLYMRKITKYGAWSGILLGGSIAAFWPLIAPIFPISIPALPPAFILSFLSIWLISKWTHKKSVVTQKI